MAPEDSFSIQCRTDIRFGVGAHHQLIDVLPKGAGSVLLIKGVSDGASAPVRAALDHSGLPWHRWVCRGEPSLASVNDAWQATQGQIIDCILVCGGGSAIDMGKALRLALQKGAPLTDADFAVDHGAPAPIPLIVLPTTAGTGAEVTANAVLGAAQSSAKISLRGRALQPDVAIVDPALMRGAPRSVVLQSGLDAVVQLIEAYSSARATPFTRALARPAIPTTLRALARVVKGDDAAWTEMAWGSLTSGLALANGGLGAVHGIASILGARLGAPHGALCGRLLWPVLTVNLAAPGLSPAAREDIGLCLEAIEQAFPSAPGTAACTGFENWLADQNLPRLSDWGLQPDEIDTVAEAAATASSSLKNPVVLSPDELAAAIRAAL